MPTCIALLRGVNVGKANRVPMAEWRALLGDLGCTDAATLLNSGNAVFGSRRAPSTLAVDIAKALDARLGVRVPVIVLRADRLDEIVADCPIDVDPGDHSRMVVAFVQEPAGLSALDKIDALVEPPERYAVGPHAAYLLCAKGLLESRAGEALMGRTTGKVVTARNWATVLKLQALARQVGASAPPAAKSAPARKASTAGAAKPVKAANTVMPAEPEKATKTAKKGATP